MAQGRQNDPIGQPTWQHPTPPTLMIYGTPPQSAPAASPKVNSIVRSAPAPLQNLPYQEPAGADVRRRRPRCGCGRGGLLRPRRCCAAATAGTTAAANTAVTHRLRQGRDALPMPPVLPDATDGAPHDMVRARARRGRNRGPGGPTLRASSSTSRSVGAAAARSLTRSRSSSRCMPTPKSACTAAPTPGRRGGTVADLRS